MQDETSNFSDNLVMLTLLHITEAERPAIFGQSSVHC
jgi:hypothetical protein